MKGIGILLIPFDIEEFAFFILLAELSIHSITFSMIISETLTLGILIFF